MEQSKIDSIWRATKGFYCDKFGQENFSILNQVELHDVIDRVCYLHASSPYIVDEIEKMKENLKEVLNKLFILEGYEVDVVVKKEISIDNNMYEVVKENDKNETESEETNLTASLRLENFVVGPSSNYSYNVCLTALNDKPLYNPILIFGGSGLGKTHLAQGVGNEILEKFPHKKVKYLTAEEFNNEYLLSIRKGGFNNFKNNIDSAENFRQKYRNLDLIIIDDIQFFEKVFGKGDGSVEEEFFNTFNALIQKEKQIILISDRNPKEIKNLSQRIKTRFLSGISTEIMPPSYSTRMAILQSFCETRNQKIENTVLEYIAEHVTENVRELQGMLNAIIARSTLLSERITIDLVKDEVERRIEVEKARITSEKIVEVTAQYFNLSEEELKSTKRNKEILKPRQIAMYIMKKRTEITYNAIGRIFGGKDHTTVLNAVTKIEKSMAENDETIKNEISEIIKRIME
ncbi:chromosomal replication initiator protein DnaA [Caviibacter abscessus]|uniref:chromosomal replication initiator protein DnaA n=1 Tax=Caviibacter abscessus TaxID=1766719 RepID=UPI000833A8AA|nr:chromosomal replication initiator protein DnaA [Caviibacter abscessus]